MDVNKEQELFIGDQQEQYTGDQIENMENETKKADFPEIEIETPHPEDLNIQGQKKPTVGFKQNE